MEGIQSKGSSGERQGGLGLREVYQNRWDELGLSNDFIFGKVMRNPALCKELLQLILPELDIDHIEYPESQKTFQADTDSKGIRVDVYVKDDASRIYDIEMQVRDTGELPQRSRYYQSAIDVEQIDKGEVYSMLGDSYIIFICMTDIFRRGFHKYTFVNMCAEDKTLLLNDGTVKIFLNARGVFDDVSDELKAFLDYLTGKKSENAYIKALDNAVERVKQNREWRQEYMRVSVRDWDNRQLGREEGIGIGREAGKSDERRARILKMLSKGYSVEEIADLYEITTEEVEKIGMDNK